MDTQQIVQNSQDISLVNVDANKSKFCDLWPQVKKGLQLLEEILKNPIAKAAIGVVVAAGDAVSKNICG